MYELIDIDPNISDRFFRLIYKVYEKPNWDAVVVVAVRQAFHSLLPEIPLYILEASMRKSLQPIIDRKKFNIVTRPFLDEHEAIEVYHNTYDDLIEEITNSKEDTDRYNLELIDYIYDLLPYDQVTIIDGEKILSSALNLSFWGEQHFEAYNQLSDLRKAKPAEWNIDTATNTNKAPKDKVKFLNDMFKIQIANPHIDSTEEELQLEFVKDYDKERHMIARSIFMCSQIPKDIPDFFPTKVIGKLAPLVNSDGEVTNHDLYKSWYAYSYGIYKRSSQGRISTNAALELSRLSSYVLFPELRAKKDFLVTATTAKKPIRECAFFNGLRLHEFTDNRRQIKRTQEEIDYTESYLKELIKNFQKLI